MAKKLWGSVEQINETLRLANEKTQFDGDHKVTQSDGLTADRADNKLGKTNRAVPK